MNAPIESRAGVIAFGTAVVSLTGLVACRLFRRDAAATDGYGGEEAGNGLDLRYPHLLHKDGDIEGMARFFDSLSNAGSFLGLDVGGSLTKMVLFQPDSLENEQDDNVASEGGVGAEASSESVDQRTALRRMLRYMKKDGTYGRTGKHDRGMRFHSRALRGCFHFINFQSQRMKGAIELAARNQLHHGLVRIRATGGGAIKYASLVRDNLGVELDHVDEMEALVKGITFILRNVPDEAFTYPSRDMAVPLEPRSLGSDAYPYLVVNIGSGVSILLVRSATEWERVSGSSLGGGTFFGLCKLMTGLDSFEAMLEAAALGDNTRVDLTVGDIYGGDYGRVGLPSSLIASSFGKTFVDQEWDDDQQHSEHIGREGGETENDQGLIAGSGGGPAITRSRSEGHEAARGIDAVPRQRADANDVARALLFMISNNLGQIAYLNAVQHGVRRIVFVGSFLRHSHANQIPMRTLAYAVKFWSGGEMEGVFLKHEGYFGAVGAFLTTLEKAAATDGTDETHSHGDGNR